ncbi:MAG TPA: hypothetical protein VLK82_03250 [Candidatus Tectomicrobia bacterium]|nr:hypothetical protein [Candidatus Tectomicrobia bacterium]
MISTVGGTTVPTTLTGSHASPDMMLPSTTPSEIPVTLTATNVPVPTQFVVKLIPAMGEPLFFPTTFSTGSFASSTATAIVRVPSNVVCVLTAFISFTQVAGLFPMIDGEEIDHIMVAVGIQEPSTMSLITKSGRALLVSQLRAVDQLRVATSFQLMGRLEKR